MNNRRLVKTMVRMLLIIVTILYIVTGFGITEFRVVETITMGVLTKNLSFKIHDILLAPFLILLVSHILLSADSWFRKRALSSR